MITEKQLRRLLKSVEKDRVKAFEIQEMQSHRGNDNLAWEYFGKRIAFTIVEDRIKKLLKVNAVPLSETK